MDLGVLKRNLQDHFTDGLVTIVGSGLSAAEGIPGMARLTDHLRAVIPKGDLDDESRKMWSRVEHALLGGENLESALQSHPPTSKLEAEIRLQTKQCLAPAELKVFQEVFGKGRTLRFTHLLKAMLKPANSVIPVITTNYDRLIELAAERAGLGLDTLFVGVHSARLDGRRSHSRLKTNTRLKGKSVYSELENHILLLKPHGSLDWFLADSEPVSCQLPIDLPGLIITPGANKFRSGYNQPFDTHRERANREIDRAARFMIIGYGFGDDHLETHLAAGLRAGKPALVLTMTLESHVQEQLIRNSPDLTVITSRPGGGAIISRGTEYLEVDQNWWDLGVFIKEVLEP